MTMENKIESQSFRFRFINCQCFEIRLPGGKTIITDPCYDFPKETKIQKLFGLDGFHTSDLEACDYVILNHTHGDHIANLGEVIERFSPKVICQSGVAAEIAAAYPDMELTSIYPVDYDGVYFFDGFKLETFHGEHKPQRTTFRKCMEESDPITGDPRFKKLRLLGGIFNMNYLLTLDNGFRAAFVGGTDDGMCERLRSIRPNLVFRNKLENEMDVEKVAGEWYSFMKNSFCQFVVPMHFEVWEHQEPGFSKKTFERANQLARENQILSRMVPVERTKWYELSLCATFADAPD